MSRYLLTHGHICIDGRREYLDGAILFEDNKLLQIFPHSNNLKEEDAEEINLKKQLVFPLYTGKPINKNVVSYKPERNSCLDELMKLKKNNEYVELEDRDHELTTFVLENLNRHKVILKSEKLSETLKILHEKGVGYSDLSLMTCINLENARGNMNTMVKGSPVSFVILDEDFNEIFRIENGEFIYA